MKPGIYADISNEDYHAGEGISKSGLDLIHRSPAHYMAAKLAPREETPALVLGTAVHAAVLEPERFLAKYVPLPNMDRRTKAGKEAFAEFQLEHVGKTLVTQEQYETALKIRDSVYSNRTAKRILDNGESEKSVYWTEDVPVDGNNIRTTLCKCRPDYYRPGFLIADLKTTEDARSDHFLRSVVNYRYYVQQAWYQRGLNANGGGGDFIFIAVEKAPPYAVGLYALPDNFVEQGVYEAQADLTTFAKCTLADNWPAYSESIQELDMPKWLKG